MEHGTSTETIDQEESVENNQVDTASSQVAQEEYVSSKGVRFTPPEAHKEGLWRCKIILLVNGDNSGGDYVRWCGCDRN